MKDFEILEEGQSAIDQLVSIVAVVIVVALLVVLGGSIITQTIVQTQGDTAALTDTNVKAALDSATLGAVDVVDLTVGYSPILVLAVIAGIALTAMLGFLAMGGRGNQSAF